MPLTYKYTIQGFSTIITVNKDNNVIYTGETFRTFSLATKNALLNEAKVALQDNYPEVMAMTEDTTPEQVKQSSETSPSPQPQPAPTPVPTQKAPVTQIPKEPTTAQGLNKASVNFSKAILNIQNKINTFYFGKPATQDVKSKRLKNPLDYGLKPMIDLLGSVDFCNIVNYALNKVSNSKPFDPKDTKGTNTKLGKIKYDIQYFAYEIQSYIDDFYATNSNLGSIISTTALKVLHIKMSEKTAKIINSGILFDPVLLNAFPQMNVLGNYLRNSMAIYNKYTDIQALPFKEVQKFLKFIDTVKKIAVAIQSLNNPANLIAVADSFIGGEIGEQIQKLNKLIDPKRIQNVLRRILDVCQKVIKIIDTALRIVKFIQTIVRIALLIIYILKNIRQILFFGLPIPNIFTTAGISTVLAAGSDTVKTTADKLLDRLGELNSILGSIYNLFTDLSVKLYGIIQGLKIIAINLENCIDEPSTKDGETTDPPISKLKVDLKNTIADLEDSNNKMIAFIQSYDKNKNNRKSNFGGYQIKIVTEELVDEGIKLKRRYGIALDSNQISVAQSTPTFASDDSVIIQEVKLLLISKNLVKQKNITSPQELKILEESSNFVDFDDADFNIALDAIDSIDIDPVLDPPDSEDEDTEEGLGLNAFVNGIKKGGKKLRKRMKRELAKTRKKLDDANAKVDPKGKYVGKISKKNQEKAEQDDAAEVKELIKEKKQKIAHVESNMIMPSAIKRAELKKLYQELNDLEKKLAKLTNTQPKLTVPGRSRTR